MDHLFTREQIRGKIIRFGILVFLMWLLYVGYHFFSEYIVSIRETSTFWKQNWARFALREFVVYLFGFIGYLYILKEDFHPNFRLQFWILLAFFDLLCLGIGAFREFVFETVLLHDVYNRMIEVIASPVYVICFGIYALYFSYREPVETNS